MVRTRMAETASTLIIGAGQAGLATAYHLSQLGLPCLMLDAHERIGDAWRKRWDSLRLFTPTRFNHLPGLPFPKTAEAFPSKDETADYLEAYAEHFKLPVRTGIRVTELTKDGKTFVARTDDGAYRADNVVVASGYYHHPHLPPLARALRPDICQLHAKDYRNPAQLKDGAVLVVGAGNSGAEIALELSRNRPTYLSGDVVAQVPFQPDSIAGRSLFVPMLRFVAHHILTLSTPLGRKLRPKLLATTSPVVRVEPDDLTKAGVKRVPRLVGHREGLPELADGKVLEPSSLVWCTGYRPDYSWIKLPIFTKDGKPKHERGVVLSEPGLFFTGLFYQYAMSSSLLTGVGRDAEFIAKAIAKRES